ncbi:hypothetical protein ABZY09_30805 [Streptomyces sp. NPDC002928]|uniref:hypothetical protein n=1 Tax=Streptomyces sp. NPDC002928 TaxID=3154440 RepID=UPI0033BF143B
MTNPPPTKSLPDTTHRLQTAGPAAPPAAVGEPKGAARKGVPTAVGPDPQQGDGRYPVAWLHIRAPYGATPTAASTCLCGWDRRAVGERRVRALIEAHTAHRENCPLRTPQEGRTAA